MRRARHRVAAAVGVYVVVLLSLQIFLLMVGLEAFLTYDAPLAWVAGITSVGLAATAILLYWWMREIARR